MSTIESQIRLYHNVPLDNTYRNVIKGGLTLSMLSEYTFSDSSYSSQTYCRIVGQFNNKVRIATGEHFADYYMSANYISIENKSGRVLFGFITDVLYINDNVVEITFEIDCFHSYYDEYSFCKCFVERATPDPSWSPSSYSIPDYIEKSEYVCLAQNDWTPTGDNLSLVLFLAPAKGKTYDTTDPDPIPTTGILTGFLTGTYVFGENAYNASASEVTQLRNMLNNAYRKGMECINAVIMPTYLYQTPASVFVASSDGNIGNIASEYAIIMNGTLNGVNVKNKKVLTYPYTCLEVTNNLGDVKRFAWEGWSGTPQFTVRAVTVPSPIITLIPRNYFGKDYDFDNCISIDNFPSMPVQSDTIASWQNQNNASSILKGLSTTLCGAIIGATQGPVGAVVGGITGAVSGTLDYATNATKASNSPSSMTASSGAGSTLILPQIDKLGFTFRALSLRGDCIQAIDDYFTRFGVAEQRVDYPPIHRATNRVYNYIKTKGCTIRGQSMPVWAERKICEIHDNGVTYWDSLSDVGDY